MQASATKAKEESKRKEIKLQHNNTSDAWRGMRIINGYKQKNHQVTMGGTDRADDQPILQQV